MLANKNHHGDTIIEVLFAIAIFSLIAVGGLAIMNSGTSAAQRALEITLVRQQIDAQAEALRFIHHSYVSAYQPSLTTYTGPAAEWASIRSGGKIHDVASDFQASSSGCPVIPAHAFVMNARTATIASAMPRSMSVSGSSRPYAQIVYGDDDETEAVGNDISITSVDGIWVEAIETRNPGEETLNQSSYIDFHIRACWDRPGQAVPMILGTIVRLYEPRA